MIKKFKKIINLIIRENIFKYLNSRNEVNSKNFPNIAFPAFDAIGPHISVYGRFENNELKVLENKVFSKIDSSKSTCLDIGANVGNHSIFFSSFFLNVYSFEPQPDNYYLLKFNTRKFKNIKTFSFGSSDADEIKILYTPNSNNLGFSTLDGEGLENEKRIDKKYQFDSETKVELKNLDNFLNKSKEEKISFIKIDVEGHEYKSLVGLKNIIEKDSPIIAIEQFVSQFDKVKKTSQTTNLLKQYGYEYFYEPNFFIRKKVKNKFLRFFNKLYYYVKILINEKKIDTFKLKKIENFEVKSYPMILVSKFNLLK